MIYKIMDYAGIRYGFPLKIDDSDKNFDKSFSGIKFATYEITNNERVLVRHKIIMSKDGDDIDTLIQKLINDDNVDVFSLESKSKDKNGKTHYYINYYVTYFSEEEEDYYC